MYKNQLINVAVYSLLSGLLACLVSITVKLAFNTDLVITNKSAGEKFFFNLLSLERIARVAFIALSFLFNSLMWIFYSKGLHLSTSTLYTTALNKFSNFIASALFGYFLFEEKLNLFRWIFGLFILLIGILILNDDQPKEQLKSNSNVPEVVQQGQQRLKKD